MRENAMSDIYNAPLASAQGVFIPEQLCTGISNPKKQKTNKKYIRKYGASF
jgi:hypothetical protein